MEGARKVKRTLKSENQQATFLMCKETQRGKEGKKKAFFKPDCNEKCAGGEGY